MFIFVLVFDQSFFGKVSRDPTTLRWVAHFVAIRLLLDKWLIFNCLVGWWLLVVRSFLFALCLNHLSLLAPQTAGGLRQNLTFWWIMHSYPIIYLGFICGYEPLNHLELCLDFFLWQATNLADSLHSPLPYSNSGWSWCWRPKSQALLRLVGGLSRHYSGSHQWLSIIAQGSQSTTIGSQ